MVAERRQYAFTLIELLVVVSIIALLIAILLPSLGRARQQAKSSVCLSNLKQIGAGMTMYTSDFRGWLPVGPADKLQYVGPDYRLYNEPGPGRRIYPWSNCHWGGRRAEYIHDVDPNKQEALARPLTGYVHRGAGLDDDTPIFRCPDDKGSEGWKETVGKPVYQVCGNSYYTFPWVDYEGARRRSHKTTSRIVLAAEAPWYFATKPGSPGPQTGWHGPPGAYNGLFLDFHAAHKLIRSNQPYGADWVIENYFEIMDYYAY